jgi:AraC-like DNA-binding protein
MLETKHSPHPSSKRSPQPLRPRVGTWLTPRERGEVEMAAGALLSFVHRDTLQALRHDLVTACVDSALVSASLVRRSDVPALSALVQDFPGTPTLGLVSEIEEARALAGALAFGQAGIRRLIDVRTAGGWPSLRGAFDPERLRDPFIRNALRELTGSHNEIGGERVCTSGWSRFLEAAFAPQIVSAKRVALSLGVCGSTLTSRFFRAGLPSPKRYVAQARLVWSAYLGETPGLSLNAIAERMDASSPQSFGRMVRILVGVSAGEFRRSFDGAAMLERFRTTMIDPYREPLKTFDPLTESHEQRAKARGWDRSRHSGHRITGSAA